MASKMGEWAFLVGVLVAIVAAIFSGSSTQTTGIVTLVLVVLGLIVGLLNVTEKETTPFLVASAALLLTGTAQTSLMVIPPVALGKFLANAVSNIAVFVTPAAVVVALKAIKALAKD